MRGIGIVREVVLQLGWASYCQRPGQVELRRLERHLLAGSADNLDDTWDRPHMTMKRSIDVLLLDDVRSFRDGRACLLARTADAAIAILNNRSTIGELWLDYDLGTEPDGRTRTARPVIDELVRAARNHQPHDIATIRVHTANPSGAVWMIRQLQDAGYPVERTYNLRIFVNRRTEEPERGRVVA